MNEEEKGDASFDVPVIMRCIRCGGIVTTDTAGRATPHLRHSLFAVRASRCAGTGRFVVAEYVDAIPAVPVTE